MARAIEGFSVLEGAGLVAWGLAASCVSVIVSCFRLTLASNKNVKHDEGVKKRVKFSRRLGSLDAPLPRDVTINEVKDVDPAAVRLLPPLPPTRRVGVVAVGAAAVHAAAAVGTADVVGRVVHRLYPHRRVPSDIPHRAATDLAQR